MINDYHCPSSLLHFLVYTVSALGLDVHDGVGYDIVIHSRDSVLDYLLCLVLHSIAVMRYTG